MLQSPKGGYVQLVAEPKTIKGHRNPEVFKQAGMSINGYRAMEINEHGALIFDKTCSALASIDSEDILSYFHCHEQNGIIMPIECSENLIESMHYMAKIQSRKGGYSDLLRRMVITHSLLTGKFNDSILWQNETSQAL